MKDCVYSVLFAVFVGMMWPWLVVYVLIGCCCLSYDGVFSRSRHKHLMLLNIFAG